MQAKSKRYGVDDYLDDSEEDRPAVRMMREKRPRPQPEPLSTQRMRLSSSEGKERGITMDSGASSHFLTEETTSTIDFREQSGPVEITVDTAKKGETF
jgi:hypothetical protein